MLDAELRGLVEELVPVLQGLVSGLPAVVGPQLGERVSSAQITALYGTNELVGRQVVAVAVGRRRPAAPDDADAVADGYLVPPRAVSVPLRFQREGIRYDDLSEEEKDAWDALDWDEDDELPPDSVGADAVNKWLFNADTVDKVIAEVAATRITDTHTRTLVASWAAVAITPSINADMSAARMAMNA